MIDAAVLHFLTKAKAYAGLLGALLTGLIALGAIPLPEWCTAAAAALTWFGVWAVPNADPIDATDMTTGAHQITDLPPAAPIVSSSGVDFPPAAGE